MSVWWPEDVGLITHVSVAEHYSLVLSWYSGDVALLVASLFLSVSLILLKVIGQLLEGSFLICKEISVSSWDLLVYTAAVLSLMQNWSIRSDLVQCQFLFLWLSWVSLEVDK